MGVWYMWVENQMESQLLMIYLLNVKKGFTMSFSTKRPL